MSDLHSRNPVRGRLVRLCQKELKETIRDRRTIVTLILMPLLVYPILSMALNRFLLASAPMTPGFTVCVLRCRRCLHLEDLRIAGGPEHAF